MSDLWNNILADIQTTYEYKCGYENGKKAVLDALRSVDRDAAGVVENIIKIEEKKGG